MMAQKVGNNLLTTSNHLVVYWVCITPQIQSRPLPEPVSNILLIETIPLNSQPRTPFLRSTMVSSRTSSRKCMKRNSSNCLYTRRLITSTDLLMIWLLKLLKEMVESYGHSRITMEMFKVILLLKVMALSVL